MRMNERMKKALSALLCVSMLAQNAPVVAFAAQEDCVHHAEHTAECGYMEAVEGQPCTHSHDTAVCGYAEAVEGVLCACTENDENGALVHTEGCGYTAPVAGSDCNHVCDSAVCGYVAAAEAHECHYECAECAAEEEEQETAAPSEPETTDSGDLAELRQTVTCALELDAVDFDNDEAFAAYVERLFYGDSAVSTFAPLAGDRLQGAEKVIYDRMKVHVAAIAAGSQPAASFIVSSADLGIIATLTETEMGEPLFVENEGSLSFTTEAQTELVSRFLAQLKIQSVLYALLSDCPYDLYWFDKANANVLCNMGAAQDENGELYGIVTDLVLTLPVAKDYQDPETGALKTDKITVAAQAAATAKSIAAAANQGKTDYEKLVAYKNYICGAVSYNFDSVAPEYTGGYGAPWQMIYVFDGDPETNVVCEGYSKAFQYLCEQSGIDCISVAGPFGDENTNGPHMWNIVTLEGKNYLVDVTNSDEGACGQYGGLFLAGNATGSVAEGYSFYVGVGDKAGTVKYEYDPAFLALWGTEALTLATEDYPVEVPAPACDHSTGTLELPCISNGNGTHTGTYSCCGAIDTENCSGGTATCEGRICEKCNTPYHYPGAYVNGFCPDGCYERPRLVGDTYQIANAGNLYWFADKVNNDNSNFQYANAILTADIKVNENVLKPDGTLSDNSATFLSWTPIGAQIGKEFRGRFDGRNHTISGLYVDGNANHVGLFGKVYASTVQNVGIIDSYFKGNQYVGGVVGYTEHKTAVTNCYNAGTVSGNDMVGGVAGRVYYSNLTNCYNTGSVSGNSGNVGGVVGYMINYTLTDCYNTGSVNSTGNYTGGVAGQFGAGTVTNCYNTGSVNGKQRLGGVVGHIIQGTMTNCYNTGSLRGTHHIGGVAGYFGASAATNCYNTGSVIGAEDVGGVAGTVSSSAVTNCYNTGSLSRLPDTSYFKNVGGLVGGSDGTVTNCYSTGSQETGTQNYSGLVGINTGSVANCYYLTDSETDDETAKTTAAFASGEVAFLLQNGVQIGETTYSGAVWGQDLEQHTAPVFTETKVYCGYVSCVEMVYTNDRDISPSPLAHSFGQYTYDDNNHSRSCSVCSHPETAAHTFKEATCMRPAYCSVCSYEKGAVDPDNHILVYTANGSTITVSCSENCDYSGTATVSAADATYTGNAVTATVSTAGKLAGETIGITYYQDDKALDEPAINAGTYTAAITVGGADASVDFTIAPATPVLSWDNHTVTYTGEPAALPALTVTLVNGEQFSGAITCSYDGGKPGVPTDAGIYEVTASVAAAGNYSAASKTIQLTIAKAVADVKEIPAQKHFLTYATSSSLDLSGFLPKDRGETQYTLGTIEGDFFVAGTAVTNGVLHYATNGSGTETEGTIEICVAMKNYADVTLTVAVERVATAGAAMQTVKEELTDVPAGLAGTSFNTVGKIKTEQNRVLTQLLGEDPKDNVIHYDMKLQFSPDGGKTWVDATPENFPAEGLTVTLPYPSGTGKNTHNFAVSHMFTAGSKAGTTETPAITKTDSGIAFTLTGMSPVSVAWTAIRFHVAAASADHGKVTVSPANAPAGTQVTIKVTPDSGYRLSTLTVLDAAGHNCVLGAVNDNTYVFTMPASNVTVKATFVSNSTAAADTTNPKTGDDFHIHFWSGMMITTMLGVVLLLKQKKFFGK